MKNQDSKSLNIKINGESFEIGKQYLTGTEVRKLGNIPSEDEIFLKIKEPWKDEPISDETIVDLARPGLEHFYSIKVHQEVIIIVDGSPKKWQKQQISFQEVVLLAFGSCIESPTMVYTVAYEDGPKQNPDGSLLKGAVVFVINKMIFHATATDKS